MILILPYCAALNPTLFSTVWYTTSSMKQGIHPNWHQDCKVTCSCGNVFLIGSTFEELQVDICNKCHPFFTGEMKFVDRQGRVDKFMKKLEKAKVHQASGTNKMKTKKTSDDPQKSYKQILRDKQTQIATPAA